MNEDFPILYLFVRDDMTYSMTPGRAAAQMSHATSVFHKRMEFIVHNPDVGTQTEYEFSQKYSDWKASTPYGYGVVFVKAMSLAKMYEYERLAGFYKTYAAEVVIDPEYKFKDGEHIFTSVDVPTGMWAFGMASDMKSFFSIFPFY